MSKGACYIRHKLFHSRHFTLSLTSTLYATLTKVFVTQVCHKHVLIVPSRIVFFNINFAGCEEFVGKCEVLFKPAELGKFRKRYRKGV